MILYLYNCHFYGFTVLVILDFIYAEDFLSFKVTPKPERCYGTDELQDRQCCIFPPFFNRETARECGAMFVLTFNDKSVNVTGIKREFLRDCDYWECILEKYGLLDLENNLSVEKYFDHLDVWVGLNPSFRSVILTARTHCRQMYKIMQQLPINTCDFFEFQGCIRHYVNMDCPEVIQSPECMKWKLFYEECREYFL